MRLTSSRAYTRPSPVPRMPPGLVELMDGLARDVLMHNPTNVFEFCANHMEKLLEIRDGPSTSKKPLTLEQKILNAQEKMRQKAQERREKFDKEIKLQPTVDYDVTDTPSVSEDPGVPGPSHRDPIHHDLKNASEVEISHVVQVEKALLCERTDNSNNEETNSSKEATQNVLSENITGAGNQNTEEIGDEQHGQKVETKSKELDEEPLFGKVEKEVTNAEPLNELLEDIVEILAVDSPLQTIKEASEENFVSDNAIILPKITIGEDGHDPDNLSDEPQKEVQLDIRNELNNEDLAEGSTEKSPDLQNKSENDVLDCSDTKNETIIPESTFESITPDSDQNCDKDQSDSTSANSDKQKDVSNDIPVITQTSNSSAVAGTAVANPVDSDLQQATSSDSSNKVLTDEIQNTVSSNIVLSIAHTPDVKHSHDGYSVNEPVSKDAIEDTQSAANDEIENSDVSEATQNSKEDTLKEKTDVEHVKISTENESNLEAETDVEHVKVTTENEDHLKAEADIEHVKNTIEDEDAFKTEIDIEQEQMPTENESNLTPKTDVEHMNITENQKVDANTNNNTGKIEPEMIEQTLKAGEENLGNDYEKHTENTEISLQKSDSTENTNEDSLSIVESDLSKTDDDSNQNNSNVDLETAAVTIQKVFRSFMFKSRNSTFEDNANDEHNSVDEDNDKKEEYYAAANLNKERRPLGITRMDTVLQTVNEEKSLSLSTDDSSTLSSAATTIQAHVRGFLVRNRLNSSKTYSMNSLVSSHEVLEADPEQHKNKTILNIHIVPEEGNYLSRDESLITSMDLSLDGSPPSSVNLHPLSCDISERRKMLKREDAVQSVSPPSNNSGKLSEDSVKEVLIDENGFPERDSVSDKPMETDDLTKDDNEASDVISSASTVTPTTVITISKSEDIIRSPREDTEVVLRRNGRSLTKLSSDESDVISPYVPSPRSSEDIKLVHSGEFHDVVLPTKVSRNDTSAVREFKNVLVYFLLWNDS